MSIIDLHSYIKESKKKNIYLFISIYIRKIDLCSCIKENNKKSTIIIIGKIVKLTCAFVLIKIKKI